MKNELKKEITSTFGEFRDTLKLFSQENLDTVPAKGGWSGGQCAEHINLATTGMPSICNRPTEKTDRPMDKKVQAVKDLFLDFNQKFTAPDFITPVKTQHDLRELLATAEKTEREMLEIAETHDLSLICKAFDVPGFGAFTKYEMLSFGCIHAQRHLRQLKNIRQSLNA